MLHNSQADRHKQQHGSFHLVLQPMNTVQIIPHMKNSHETAHGNG